MWESYKKGFRAWLQLERSLAAHSVEAYLRDVEMLTQFLREKKNLKNPSSITLKDLQDFMKWITQLGMTASKSTVGSFTVIFSSWQNL